MYILVPWNFDNFETQTETENIGLSEQRWTYLASDRQNYPGTNDLFEPDKDRISAQIGIFQIENYLLQKCTNLELICTTLSTLEHCKTISNQLQGLRKFSMTLSSVCCNGSLTLQGLASGI